MAIPAGACRVTLRISLSLSLIHLHTHTSACPSPLHSTLCQFDLSPYLLNAQELEKSVLLSAVYNALTATAKKLATKPDFLEDIRQRFPHIAASTERLLASVEKQQPGGSGMDGTSRSQVAALYAHGAEVGPMATLAAAVSQQQHGGGHGGAGPSRLGQGGGLLAGSRQCVEEETTMQLYSQVRLEDFACRVGCLRPALSVKLSRAAVQH